MRHYFDDLKVSLVRTICRASRTRLSSILVSWWSLNKGGEIATASDWITAWSLQKHEEQQEKCGTRDHDDVQAESSCVLTEIIPCRTHQRGWQAYWYIEILRSYGEESWYKVRPLPSWSRCFSCCWSEALAASTFAQVYASCLCLFPSFGKRLPRRSFTKVRQGTRSESESIVMPLIYFPT